MSRSRALAVLSSLVATLAMTLGVLGFTTGAASADPRGTATARQHYPAVPPSLVVNKAVVKYGVTVRASGRKYTAKERVKVTVYYIPKGSKKSKVVKTATVYADKNGKFSVRVRMSRVGTVFIAAVGQKSSKIAVAVVRVIDKKKGSGGWVIKPASFSTGLTGNGAGTIAVSSTQSTTSGSASLAVAGIALLGAAGSVLVTRQTIRRRRKVGALA